MPAGARSRNGCWTCRLRRKKCDEKRPACSVCESLGINCDGYGHRPEWMDGGEREKEAAAETRRKIKNAARREPASNQSSPAPASHASAAARQATGIPKPNPEHPSQQELALPSGTSQSQTSTITSATVATPSTNLSRKHDVKALSPDVATISDQISTEIANKEYALPSVLKEREASLLMFYLDCVFPMQFKMHSPSIADGGRGWMLSLFLRTPPLYHMTLAMSAHCLDLLSLPTSGDEYKSISLSELGLALQHMQRYIQDFNGQKEPGNLEESIKVCSCILQMIAFSCFKGGTDNWKVHLHAASSIVPVLIDGLLATFPTSESPYATTEPTVYRTLAYKTDEAAMKFLIGVFLWFDVCGSISTGSTPCLEKYFDHLMVGPNPKVDLQEVMGVEGWVMALIGKIASLDRWKRESQMHGRLSMIDLVTRATNIEKDLVQGIVRMKGTSLEHQQSLRHLLDYGGRVPLSNLCIHAPYVTHVYASAAVTYLHVVISGPQPELPEIRKSVSSTVELLKLIPDPLLARSFFWPLLVTGSMALEGEEDVFRHIITTSGVSPTSTGIGWNVLRVLEQCWKLRGTHHAGVSENGYWSTIMASLDLDLIVI